MKLTGILRGITRNYTNDKINITLEINEEYEIRKLDTGSIKDKLLDINLNVHKKKRSAGTNKYMWNLINKLSQARGATSEDMYIEMIERYGAFIEITTQKENIEKTLRSFKECKVLGAHENSVRIRCYYGTSKYTPSEMYYFIQGIIKECKKEKIETLTPNEIERIEEMIAL